MPVAIGAIIDGLKTQVSFVQAAMALHSLVMASYISRANAAIIDLRDLLSRG